ncbi:hypothetical protein [Lentzea sp. NBRC 102530]|uniref:hypothetical protein n=1 Tax=Lentzea sp. NBRC 102530 TaxID=3032201 RepID=UPI0024A193FE|nr:hypothetical protein [Lentzea sp. NBRC 102530]GLY49339.1 hypothetical protein Lesp01_29950 [Lentzea sp. NBRC 102530]
MGNYVSVRGWLELSHEQRDAVREVVAAHHHDLYSAGWAVPEKPFNWTLYVTYGGDLRVQALDWLRTQVAAIAKFADDDGDHPVGFFLLTGEVDDARAWIVRDGEVHEGAPPGELRAIVR